MTRLPAPRRTVRHLRYLAASTALVLLGSGCGVSGDGVHPGAAARVDGTTISMSDVDAAARAFCDTYTVTANTPLLTGYVARTTMLENLVARTVADRMNVAYGKSPSPWFQSFVAAQRAQFPRLTDQQFADYEPAATGFAYFVDLVGQFGAPSGTALSTTADQARALFTDGLPLVVAWSKTHPIETDPTLPSLSIDATKLFALSNSDQSLSEDVGAFAQQALADNDPAAATGGDLSSYASSLPLSQQCG